MKISIASLILLFFSLSCTAQKENITEVEFHAQTRGALEHIILKGNQIEYKTQASAKTIEISDDRRKKLLMAVHKVDLHKISEYKSPSENRASDRAMIATLTIKTDKRTYTSNQFDHNNPPIELGEIILILRSYVSSK